MGSNEGRYRRIPEHESTMLIAMDESAKKRWRSVQKEKKKRLRMHCVDIDCLCLCRYNNSRKMILKYKYFKKRFPIMLFNDVNDNVGVEDTNLPYRDVVSLLFKKVNEIDK